MSWIMVDIEADGPIPADYSMIEIGAVIVEPSLSKIFSGKMKPISDKYIPEALVSFNRTREETLEFADPYDVMLDFEKWINENSKERPMFIADNNGFDYAFVNWYFHHFLGRNPFGHSSSNLGSIYKGLIKNTYKNFKHLRKTKHDHNPVNDAMGNAEALLYMKNNMGLNINL